MISVQCSYDCLQYNLENINAAPMIGETEKLKALYLTESLNDFRKIKNEFKVMKNVLVAFGRNQF